MHASAAQPFRRPQGVLLPSPDREEPAGPDEYGEAGAVDAPDRRAEPRLPTLGRAWISCPTPDPRLGNNPYDRREVTSVNLSRHGVAFLSDRPLPRGSYHRIEFMLAHQVTAIEVRVARCCRVDDQWEIGGELF